MGKKESEKGSRFSGHAASDPGDGIQEPGRRSGSDGSGSGGCGCSDCGSSDYGGSRGGPVPAGILMQTTAPLNVRTGPGLQWPVIGVLAKGQTVSVAGTDASGWQIISYGGGYACVSGAYLTPAAAGQAAAAGQTLPDADVLQDPSQAALAQAAAQAAVPAAGLVFIGDSRFVQMEEAVGENPFIWIAENSKGLDWFEEKGAPRADAVIGAGTKVLINLGVNDVRNADRYVSYFNQKAAEWTLRGAVVYMLPSILSGRIPM